MGGRLRELSGIYENSLVSEVLASTVIYITPWVEAQSKYFSCLGPRQLGPAAAPGKWHPRPSLESYAPSHFSQHLL